MIADIFFYIFSVILLLSAAAVVSARNPVHSVLFLILAFFNAAALFLIAGAEFLAFILLIVYVGAVAVLFMFVVMMLDVNFAELRSGFQRYLPIGATIGAILLAELLALVMGWKIAPAASTLRLAPAPAGVQNTVALGQVLYTDYIFLFQTAGIILLVAMIGAIVLTLRERKTMRYQVVRRQEERAPADTLALVRVGLGEGIKPESYYRPQVPPKQPELAEEGAHGHGPAGGH